MDAYHEDSTPNSYTTCIDPDDELRTIPSGWDLSEYMANTPVEKNRPPEAERVSQSRDRHG
jgi:hypothetical protein